MRRSADFSCAVRTGSRARSGAVVVHLAQRDGAAQPVVGFIVGRTVGGSVVRHRVTRRLRAVLAARLDQLPAGSATVVRALPAAADAGSAELAADIDRALSRVTR
jgi:ribonuclease P protein component